MCDPTLTPEEVAVHEAGHAVMALFIGAQVKSVDVCKKQADPGDITWVTRAGHPDAWAYGGAIVSWAGPEAERHFIGDGSLHGNPIGDISRASDFLSHLCPTLADSDVALHYTRLIARGTVSQPPVWRRIEAVAAALLKRGSLSGDEVSQIVAEVREAN